MSSIPLSRLTAVGGLSLAFILACGPFGDDLTKGGSKRIEGRGSQSSSSSSSSSSSRHSSGPSSTAGGGGSSAADLDVELDCDSTIQTKRGAACAIDRISCGDTIQASNYRLERHFADDFYRSKFCTPRSADYEDSPEAVYALTLPADMQADITLLSPCTDLDLFSIRWGNADRCPSVSTSTGECEGSTKGSTDKIRIMSVGKDEEHLVWVDGKKGNTGNFELRVECRPAR